MSACLKSVLFESIFAVYCNKRNNTRVVAAVACFVSYTGQRSGRTALTAVGTGIGQRMSQNRELLIFLLSFRTKRACSVVIVGIGEVEYTGRGWSLYIPPWSGGS